MSVDTADRFVECLLKSLCRKLSGEEGDDTSESDICCNELLELSRHFEEDILTGMYEIPSGVIFSEETFNLFLNEVCGEIHSLRKDAYKRIAILSAFVVNLVTLSFKVPCYRLIDGIKIVYTSYMERYFKMLKKDPFENLQRCSRELKWNKSWMDEIRQELRSFIGASNIVCFYDRKKPVLSSSMKTVKEDKSQEFANFMESLGGRCPYCESNCEIYLQNYKER